MSRYIKQETLDRSVHQQEDLSRQVSPFLNRLPLYHNKSLMNTLEVNSSRTLGERLTLQKVLDKLNSKSNLLEKSAVSLGPLKKPRGNVKTYKNSYLANYESTLTQQLDKDGEEPITYQGKEIHTYLDLIELIKFTPEEMDVCQEEK